MMSSGDTESLSTFETLNGNEDLVPYETLRGEMQAVEKIWDPSIKQSAQGHQGKG